MALSFTFIGNLRKMKTTDKFNPREQKDFSGFIIDTFKFQATNGTNKHTLQIASRYFAKPDGTVDEDKTKIYTTEKKGEKFENITIPFGERLSFDTSKLAFFKLLELDLRTSEERKNRSTDNVSYFAWEGDLLEAVNTMLDDKKYENATFKVTGSVDISYSTNKNRYYQSFNVQKVYLATEEEAKRPQMIMSDTFIYGKDSWDESSYDDTKKIQIKAWDRYYDRSYKEDACKGNCFCEMLMSFDLSKQADPDGCKSSYKKRFAVPYGSDFGWIKLDIEIINGAQLEPITEDDLPDDVKEDIKYGFTTLEEELRKAGSAAYGERINEYRLLRCKNVEGTVDYTSTQIKSVPTHDDDAGSAAATTAKAAEDVSAIIDDDDIFN